mgnify:CR=1 FL=1
MDHIDRAGRALRHRAATQSLGGRRSSASGSRPAPPSGPAFGTGLNLRYADGPRDRWFVYSRVTAVGGRLDRRLGLEHAAHPAPRGAATANVAAANEELAAICASGSPGPATRLRRAAEIDLQIETDPRKHHVARYMKVARTVREDHSLQAIAAGPPRPGRPIARSPSGASTSNGRSTSRPSPTTTRATACIR